MKRVASYIASSHWLVRVGVSIGVGGSLVLYLIYQVHLVHLQVAQAMQAELQIVNVLRLSVDAETAARGYNLTKQMPFLAPLIDAEQALDNSLKKLEASLHGLELENVDLNVFGQLVTERVKFARDLAGQRLYERDAGYQLEKLNQGVSLQDEIRHKAGAISSAIKNFVQNRQNTQRSILLALVFGVISSAVLFYLLLMHWARAVNQRERIKEQASRSERIYATVFNEVAIGMLVVDEHGRVHSVNNSFGDMLEADSDLLLGIELQTLVRWDGRVRFTDALASTGERKEKVATLDVCFQNAGLSVWTRLTLADFAVKAGERRILILAHELTEDIKRQRRLIKYETLMRNASQLAGVDGWSLSLPSYQLELGSPVKTLLLGSPIGNLSSRGFLRMLERPARKELLDAIRRCSADFSNFKLQLLIKRPEREALYLELIGQAMLEDGRVVSIEGAARDVTEINAQVQALVRSEQRLLSIAQVTNDSIWELDLERKILSHNLKKAAVGERQQQYVCQWLEGVHPDDQAGVIQSFRQALHGGSTVWDREFRYVRSDGEIETLYSQAAFLRDENGVAHHVVGGAQDLTKRRKMQAAMMNMAASVASLEDEQFFSVLLRNLMAGLEADGGCIARLSSRSPAMATTLAVVIDGVRIDNFTYAVEGTPCENLLRDVECHIPDNLSGIFPGAGIGGLQARSYLGGQLLDAQGEVIGFIYLLYSKPLERSVLATSVLQVFAVRAAAEIRRIEADNLLKQQAELLDHASESIVVLDLDLRVRFWNKGAEQMYGLSKVQAVGQSVSVCYEDESALLRALSEVMHAEQVNQEFCQIRACDGSKMFVEESWTLIREPNGEPRSILKVGSDVTEKRSAEEQIKRLAYYDTLTALPNRRLFMERLSQARDNTVRDRSHAALMFIDLDNFKTLNDLHGHLKGDEFLIAIARLLSGSVRRGDTVARLGGDEFVIILEGLHTDQDAATEQARHVARQLLESFNVPLQLGEISVVGTASIGVALFRGDGYQLDELLRHADLAMYEAKDGGRNTYCVYDSQLDALTSSKAMLAAELRKALEQKQFELWYQPQFDSSRKPYGVEALLRWRHPAKGMISPADFIPLAERSSFIVELGRWVIAEACRQLAQWSRVEALSGLKISVNVSVQQLRQENFVSHVVSALQTTGASAERLVLEVTESILDEKIGSIAAKLHSLRSLGVRISLDDFGTGYSSLSRLRQLPFDEVKIDQSFTRAIPGDEDDAAIVNAIITLGRTMRMGVVAEGVENEEQLAFLLAHGCAAFQGYLFARPMPAEQLVEVLAADRAIA
ncbi:EAL domain-containing protein [Pseudomonas stutzeri]|uniref:EAL domain-containing protein n=1 Tax=Stutzerimonas stutzeri TaxID=316 RepID=UPI00190C1BF9|nr:EAL domain-containing protein [Stutzerimonas stutzeri]MBK3870347.1 EAL domain-containing protein [Stutzerimonas stutzeri]